ncbi:MAG: hypothetical protein GY820_41675 [Gammaproteobacteria bacterium]|nr:hypothetical protein [Gammaproteobacteria bacterium]
MYLKTAFIFFAYLLFTTLLSAREIKLVETDAAEIEVRVFPAQGDTLLLGFPCDEGKSIAEENTALSLSEDGIEVWMPDMLSALMLPNIRSSLAEISDDAFLALIDEATKTGKKVFLIASGPETELALRAANIYESSQNNKTLGGMILMFPRLFKAAPEPGKEPEYIDAVGKTRLPIMLLEGERTPNRWGINNLSQALHRGGSPVRAKVIPMVRGYFFKRRDSNRSETVVTSQLAGLVKVSLFYLEEKSHED